MSEFMTEGQYMEEAKKFARIVRKKAKANAARFAKGRDGDYTYKTKNEGGKSRYEGYVEKKLADNITWQVKTVYGEVHHIGFKFPLHGIYRAFGVGNGQPSQSNFSKRALKTYIKRSPSDWLNGPIEDNIDQFADLTAEFYGDKVLNFIKYSKIQNQ